jgi:predicted amidophosphoribosyltransferase
VKDIEQGEITAFHLDTQKDKKRCSVCEIFIKWDENRYCPCCNYKLRTLSFRGFGMRKKYREEIINRYLIKYFPEIIP